MYQRSIASGDLVVSWFSAGVSSAVATKLMIDRIDRILYIHIDDHHEDTMRFVGDCQEWFGKEIEVMQSPYKTVENACRAAGGRGYVNGPGGAACTRLLKRRVRKEWEAGKENLCYVWGMDASEKHRCDRLRDSMPKQNHVFPLVENNISKQEAHQILNASGLKRHAMYDLGFRNANCRGCLKGGRGYWNKVRKIWPDIFKQRAEMERLIGGTCIKGVYLDELDPESGRDEEPIVEDCGIFCQVMGLE